MSELSENAVHLLRLFRRRHLFEFTVRDLALVRSKRRFPDVASIRDALAELDDAGLIAFAGDPVPDGPGRPPSPRYLVDPSVLETREHYGYEPLHRLPERLEGAL